MSAVHYPVQPMDSGSVVCVSGAGDCFAAAFISSALRAAPQDEAVAAGIQGGTPFRDGDGADGWRIIRYRVVRLNFAPEI